ncbi:pyridoxamine 5-phosphate oxidase [bacterium]|nr:pyridoxamine 5-phosphate oxidase [bacterium]
MTDSYGQIAFTDAVKQVQELQGSRRAYARGEAGPERKRRLSPEEVAFIRTRDCFFMASVSETGWPYLQHRGGPGGFLHVLDDRRLAFVDYCGNRQYITTGNVAGNDRVALLLMDFAKRRRLKLFGRMQAVALEDNRALTESLIDPAYVALHDATVERAFVITVEAFDWNCPQHIQPRFTEAEIRAAFARHGVAAPCGPGPMPDPIPEAEARSDA